MLVFTLYNDLRFGLEMNQLYIAEERGDINQLDSILSGTSSEGFEEPLYDCEGIPLGTKTGL